MAIKFINRAIEPKLKSYLKQFRVVSLTGPRQSGKTTLIKELFPERTFLSLENPQNREFAIEDPNGFIKNAIQKSKYISIDEAQYVPELFSYIQEIVDENNLAGQFLLSGSQNFLLNEKISQSLAGRVGNLYLQPFSYQELPKKFHLKTLEENLVRGFYPALINHKISNLDWYANYIETYIEKDVRQLINIGDINSFRKFLKLCAARTGQVINYSEIANSCDVSHNTVKKWISVLEASFIIKLSSTFHRNFNKRLIKSPKLYFLDSGICSNLLGLNNESDLELSRFKGGIFESYIFSELYKFITNRGLRKEIYYWRERSGLEIDFIVEAAKKILAIEAKASKTIRKEHYNFLDKFKSYAKKEIDSYLIYAGDDTQTREEFTILNWKDNYPKLIFNEQGQ